MPQKGKQEKEDGADIAVVRLLNRNKKLDPASPEELQAAAANPGMFDLPPLDTRRQHPGIQIAAPAEPQPWDLFLHSFDNFVSSFSWHFLALLSQWSNSSQIGGYFIFKNNLSYRP